MSSIKKALLCANLGDWDRDSIGLIGIFSLDIENLNVTLAEVLGEFVDPVDQHDLVCLTNNDEDWNRLKDVEEMNEYVLPGYDERFVIYDLDKMVFIGLIWVD